MFIYFFTRIITCIICITYVYQMFNYIGIILEKRNNKVEVIVPLIVGGIFTGFTFSNIPIPIIYILIHIIMALFFYIVFNGGFLQIVFASGSFVFHILVLRGLVLAIIALLYGKCMYCLIRNDITYIVSLCISLLSASLFLFLFRRLYKDSKMKILSNSNRQLKFLVAAQSALNFLLLLLCFSYYYKLDVIWSSYYHLISSILIIIIYYVIFNHCAENNVRIENEIKLEVVERQLESQLEDYYSQIKYINSVKKFKHDYKNIMLSMSSILENGDIHKAKEFLYDIEKELEIYNEMYKEYSNNPLIQAILTKIGNKANEEEIDFSAEVIFPNCFVMSDLDICRVFSNIMDNAMEALMKLNKNENRFIKVQGMKRLGWFTLIEENSFNGDIIIDNYNIHTSKKDKANHGFGIHTVRDIVTKRDGIFVVKPDMDKKIFKLTIHIPYKEDN